MLNLILPQTRANLTREYLYHLPLYFLAGPVLGGGDWQKAMTDMLVQKLGDCIVVNPSRYQPNHPHYQYQVGGLGGFETQSLWERHYLQKAASEWPSGGCIILWLACENKAELRNDGNPCDEISEWRAHLMHNPEVRLVVGAEPDFPGLRTIRRNFDDAVGNGFKIYETMQEVVECASRFA